MKEHTFSIKSWHFWLANYGHKRVWADENVDICSYIRKILAGGIALFFAVFLATGAILFFGYGYITGAIWFYDCITAGVWDKPNFAAVFTIFCTLLLLTIILVALALDKITELKYKIKHNSRVNSENTQPSFIATVYKKFKSKTCFRIGFTK